jgi:hypothetical protein
VEECAAEEDVSGAIVIEEGAEYGALVDIGVSIN